METLGEAAFTPRSIARDEYEEEEETEVVVLSPDSITALPELPRQNGHAQVVRVAEEEEEEEVSERSCCCCCEVRTNIFSGYFKKWQSFVRKQARDIQRQDKSVSQLAAEDVLRQCGGKGAKYLRYGICQIFKKRMSNMPPLL